MRSTRCIEKRSRSQNYASFKRHQQAGSRGASTGSGGERASWGILARLRREIRPFLYVSPGASVQINVEARIPQEGYGDATERLFTSRFG
jgi:hypothetical protein